MYESQHFFWKLFILLTINIITLGIAIDLIINYPELKDLSVKDSIAISEALKDS
jgi:hypothetical protein